MFFFCIFDKNKVHNPMVNTFSGLNIDQFSQLCLISVPLCFRPLFLKKHKLQSKLKMGRKSKEKTRFKISQCINLIMSDFIQGFLFVFVITWNPRCLQSYCICSILVVDRLKNRQTLSNSLGDMYSATAWKCTSVAISSALER